MVREICEEVKRDVGDIVAEWEHLVGDEPWCSLPPEHRIDHLPELVTRLVDAALCHPLDLDTHRDKVSAACTHGLSRRDQGISEHLILTEYHILRRAFWNYLVRKFGSSPRTADAIMRLDMALTLATTASLCGYHREELEASGRWDAAIERIVATSPLLIIEDR